MTLAGMLAASGDDLGAHKLYLDMLADAEAKHGAESREVLIAIPPVLSYFYTQGRYERSSRTCSASSRSRRSSTAITANELRGVPDPATPSLLGMRGEYAAALRLYEQAYRDRGGQREVEGRHGDARRHEGARVPVLAGEQQPKAIELYNRAIAIVDRLAGLER